MSVRSGFTLIEMLISLLITSLLTLMVADLSGASLAVFSKNYLLESHTGHFNALLFGIRQEVSKACSDIDDSDPLVYIEANRDGISNSCVRFTYNEDGEIKKGGFRLDSGAHCIERYSPHGDNWSCSAGYWQDLHDSRFEVDRLQFSYQDPTLLLELDVLDQGMHKEERFYVSAYVKR